MAIVLWRPRSNVESPELPVDILPEPETRVEIRVERTSMKTATPNTTCAIELTVNGVRRSLSVEPRVSLLDALRDHLGLTGTKKGCNQGACGACTVLADGERINACFALAVQYQGREITTIEGLGKDGKLHPLQSAFVEHDGFQCGYCTPGQICSAIGMAAEWKRQVPSARTADLAASRVAFNRDELRERMSGNLCRCGAYNGIVDAVAQVFEEELTR
jgi:xanthine dehydrogenase YagT iron-sulfur-binding subunit